MLYKSLPKSKCNRFPWQRDLVLHTSLHITCCFDFLPFCLSTQLMASLPAWVIRAECINLVFIYSLWIQHRPTKLEIFLLFGTTLYHCWHFLLNLGTFSWPLSSGLGRVLLEVTLASACGLGVSPPSIHASGRHVHCLKASQTAAGNKNLDGFWYWMAPASLRRFVDSIKTSFSLLL